MIRVGHTEGTCSRCGKTLTRRYPADTAVCDCWKYCPNDHGKGPYGTLMDEYVPDMTANTYRPLKNVEGETWGDLKRPMNILRKCSACEYHSSQKPIEVDLS